jgi:hypothetical protein
MADQLSALEVALRGLPLPYWSAPRLRDAGIVPEVVCEYNESIVYATKAPARRGSQNR